MPDIATIWDPATGTGDWAIDAPKQLLWTDELGNSIVDEVGNPIGSVFTSGNGLVTGSDLYTSALISLFTDAQAEPDDIIPDGSNDPRGWWAGPIGSKLWLRERSKATSTLPALIKNDIEQALAWFIADGVVAAIDVAVEYERPGMIGAVVVFRRQDGARAALRFSRLWESI